ncbi:MAG: hypothetical protein RIQ73_843, partial [Actinomycetota bacterium]
MVRNGAAFGSSVAANLLPSENGQCERGDLGCGIINKQRDRAVEGDTRDIDLRADREARGDAVIRETQVARALAEFYKFRGSVAEGRRDVAGADRDFVDVVGVGIDRWSLVVPP